MGPVLPPVQVFDAGGQVAYPGELGAQGWVEHCHLDQVGWNAKSEPLVQPPCAGGLFGVRGGAVVTVSEQCEYQLGVPGQPLGVDAFDRKLAQQHSGSWVNSEPGHGVDQALVVAIIQVGDAADDAGESGLGERALQRGQSVATALPGQCGAGVSRCHIPRVAQH